MVIESRACLSQEEALTQLMFHSEQELYYIAVNTANYIRVAHPKIDIDADFTGFDSQDFIDWFTSLYKFNEVYQTWDLIDRVLN